MATWYGVTSPSFQPSARVITNITQASPAVITTGINHLYIDKMIVRIDMYSGNGMPQMNQQFGNITVLTPTTFAITIDSSKFDPFILQATPTAQAVPFSEDNSILTASVQNVQPGVVLPPGPLGV